MSFNDWKSSIAILSTFVRNHDESLHLMGILKRNEADPQLYLYMYHMFFFSIDFCPFTVNPDLPAAKGEWLGLRLVHLCVIIMPMLHLDLQDNCSQS